MPFVGILRAFTALYCSQDGGFLSVSILTFSPKVERISDSKAENSLSWLSAFGKDAVLLLKEALSAQEEVALIAVSQSAEALLVAMSQSEAALSADGVMFSGKMLLLEGMLLVDDVLLLNGMLLVDGALLDDGMLFSEEVLVGKDEALFSNAHGVALCVSTLH